jgi:hypothetical protein
VAVRNPEGAVPQALPELLLEELLLELEELLDDELELLELELLLDEEELLLEPPPAGSVTVQVGWLKLPSWVPCTPKVAL